MAVPINLLRALLGLLCIFFAHMLGRAIIGVRQRRLRRRSLIGWLVRTLLTAGAMLYGGGLDRLAGVAYLLAIASLVLGIWDEFRPKHQEDLTRKMFGE